MSDIQRERYDSKSRSWVDEFFDPLTGEWSQHRRDMPKYDDGPRSYTPSAKDEFRVNYDGAPPWILWALHIVKRDAEVEGYELPSITQERMSKLTFESKLDALMRIHARQQLIDAMAEVATDDDWPWHGGIPNRFDFRRR